MPLNSQYIKMVSQITLVVFVMDGLTWIQIYVKFEPSSISGVGVISNQWKTQMEAIE